MSERQYWVGFNLVKGVGPVRVKQLLEYFGSLGEAWRAPASALRRASMDRRAINSLLQTRERIDPGAELARLDKLGIATLTWDDDAYPVLLAELKAIDQAPPVVYLRGTLHESDEWAVAIVGTRSVSAYGRQVTHHLASALAVNGITVISGLARGADAEAHEAVLDTGGRTIAVLPCGMDMIYPPEHRNLAARIMRQGAVMSIFPLGTKPVRTNFAVRNRVMSGLARGVLVTEAGLKSGALITARCALEQGREVFAVPGNITARGSAGTNRLIQDGAHPVLEDVDVLDVLNLERAAVYAEAREELPGMSDDEKMVLGCLTKEPIHIDELTQQSGLPVATVSSVLVTLELKGMARQVDAMTYVRA